MNWKDPLGRVVQFFHLARFVAYKWGLLFYSTFTVGWPSKYGEYELKDCTWHNVWKKTCLMPYHNPYFKWLRNNPHLYVIVESPFLNGLFKKSPTNPRFLWSLCKHVENSPPRYRNISRIPSFQLLHQPWVRSDLAAGVVDSSFLAFCSKHGGKIHF